MQKKSVGFIVAIKKFFKKYFVFNDVAVRSEYWFGVLFVLSVMLLIICLNMALASSTKIFNYIEIIWLAVIFVPCISLSSRRLHDIGFSAKWLLFRWISFLFFIVGLPALILMGSNICWKECPRSWEFFGNISVIGFCGFIFTSLAMYIMFCLPSKIKNNHYRKTNSKGKRK